VEKVPGVKSLAVPWQIGCGLGGGGIGGFMRGLLGSGQRDILMLLLRFTNWTSRMVGVVVVVVEGEGGDGDREIE
jgi:hypothetical protein